MCWHYASSKLECHQVPVMAILKQFRELAGPNGRKSHRPAERRTYDYEKNRLDPTSKALGKQRIDDAEGEYSTRENGHKYSNGDGGGAGGTSGARNGDGGAGGTSGAHNGDGGGGGTSGARNQGGTSGARVGEADCHMADVNAADDNGHYARWGEAAAHRPRMEGTHLRNGMPI